MSALGRYRPKRQGPLSRIERRVAGVASVAPYIRRCYAATLQAPAVAVATEMLRNCYMLHGQNKTAPAINAPAKRAQGSTASTAEAKAAVTIAANDPTDHKGELKAI